MERTNLNTRKWMPRVRLVPVLLLGLAFLLSGTARAQQPAAGAAQSSDKKAPAGGDKDKSAKPSDEYASRMNVNPANLFRLESEAALLARLKREATSGPSPKWLDPPKDASLSELPMAARCWPPRVAYEVPGFVCYGRLYFEQINAERYGNSIGCLQPLLSIALFYKDVFFLPYHLGTDPCRHYECDAGYALPGDCVPLLCYKPEWSRTGALLQAAAITGIVLVLVAP